MDNQIDILDTIIFSKEFRRLEDKTQLFPASSGVHYRNRMTHTMEVLVIAKKIGKELNEIIKNDNFYNSQKIDEDLIEAIALAHDLGHTPFGHIGERTLNDILSRKDKLGIIEESSDDFKTSSFKHNINSGKILMQNFKDIDVKVIDGAIKHTFIFYNDFNDNGLLSIISINKCNEKFKNFGGEKIQYWKILYPITIEGQIVAIADEIAQRCADLDDTYRTRYLNKINNLIDYDNLNINSDYMKVSKESNLSQYDIVISKVKRILIEGVKESFKEIIRNNTNLNFEN